MDLNFNDFQKQDIKFDINKLQKAYKEILNIKDFSGPEGISNFGAISLTQIPGDPESIKGHKARGVFWTKPNSSGKEVLRDSNIEEYKYTEFVKEFRETYFHEVYNELSKNYNLLSKEHNGDYLSLNDMQLRFDYGLDSINIAPELCQFETDIFLDLIKKLDREYFEDFFQICYESKRWEKWIKPGFNPEKEKEKIIKISGHYVFSEPDFDNLKKRIAHKLEIDVSILDERVKDRIKNYLNSFQKIIA